MMFGEAAARLCGAAVMLLGWRPEEFWTATPAELALALQPPQVSGEAPDPETIDRLMLQFPD
jgi:hypothetical protein